MQQQQESSDESCWLEEQCHREINAQHDEYEREYTRQRDSALSTVWGAFQDSATAVAHLYRERSSNTFPDTGALWLPFQTAAGTVTTLYKESCDGLKRSGEAAIQCGYQRRTRELADWARSKKRRMIRREDLLAYLAGKPLPPSLTSTHVNRRSPKPEHTTANHHHLGGGTANALGYPATMVAAAGVASSLPPHHILSATQQTNAATLSAAGGGGGGVGNGGGLGGLGLDAMHDHVNDLHTFKEALVLRPRGPELFAFVANEIARHCKRPGSPIDDKMDVCHYSSKRQRFM